MNNLQVFKNEKFGTVRTITENGKTLFCGTDIARSLGYTNPQKAIRDHCKGGTKRSGVSLTTNQHGVTTEQVTEMTFIPEGYMVSKTTPITHSDGRVELKVTSLWTAEGRKFLYDFLKERGILPLNERGRV